MHRQTKSGFEEIMNLQRLHEILDRTTVQLRKGEQVTMERVGPLDVVTIDAMPHESEALDSLEKVDMELLVVGVDGEEAKKYRSELVSILDKYPDPKRLAKGPSYIEVGAEIGDQGAAFQLFALGKVLGLWEVITPATLGLKERARELAGMGMIMISGYNGGKQ
jgi:hypothetical protein